MKEIDLKILKKISITGRFAIGLICLKMIFREKNLHQMEESRFLFSKYSSYVSKFNKFWGYEIEAYFPNDFKTGKEIIEYLTKFNLLSIDEIMIKN